MPLLNPLPQDHASLARNSTVRLVPHLLTSRLVPPVTIFTISLEVPASLVPSPTV